MKSLNPTVKPGLKFGEGTLFNNVQLKLFMKTINAAIIGCDVSKQYFQDLGTNKLEKFHWKKVYVDDALCKSVTTSFPASEQVTTIDAILNDADISIVFVSSKHLEFANQIIMSGKAVRVV